jgi:hypothetical protein
MNTTPYTTLDASINLPTDLDKKAKLVQNKYNELVSAAVQHANFFSSHRMDQPNPRELEGATATILVSASGLENYIAALDEAHDRNYRYEFTKGIMGNDSIQFYGNKNDTESIFIVPEIYPKPGDGWNVNRGYAAVSYIGGPMVGTGRTFEIKDEFELEQKEGVFEVKSNVSAAEMKQRLLVESHPQYAGCKPVLAAMRTLETLNNEYKRILNESGLELDKNMTEYTRTA